MLPNALNVSQLPSSNITDDAPALEDDLGSVVVTAVIVLFAAFVFCQAYWYVFLVRIAKRRLRYPQSLSDRDHCLASKAAAMTLDTTVDTAAGHL